jgi:short-subunit dehydrogenase
MEAIGMDELSFATRYGPWAVVAGASEGVGECFARAVAERGINVVLLARRQSVLDDVAASIRSTSDVEVRPVAVDLATDDAMRTVRDATDDLEVGLVMYCAGADPNYTYFLDQSTETAKAMIHRNCVVPMEMCHHFVPPMRTRRRGGVIIVGSGGGLIGAPYMVTYGATKAFDMVFAESLWAEVHDDGVDVLGLILALTDTPATRRLMVRRGKLASMEAATPLEGAVSAEDTAAEALEQLPNGPTWFVGDMLREGAQQLGLVSRSDAVKLMIEMGDATMGADPMPADTPPNP